MTTTSYSVLGLLSLGDWSAYELAGLMARSVGLILPRSLSVIYEEPKRLAARDLVRATTVKRGRRSVAVYSITPAGTRALRQWLAEPTPFPQLDAEVIAKALFSDNQSLGDLRDRISAFRSEAEERLAALRQQSEGYLATGGPFPQRLPVIALSGKFVLDYHAFLVDWARWAERELAAWPADRAWAEAVFIDARDIYAARLPAEEHAAPAE